MAASGYVGGTGIASPQAASGAYTVVNFGRIDAPGVFYDGVGLFDGGRVTNGRATNSAASIAGWRGVDIEQAVGTVVNFAAIAATDMQGVLLDAGGRVTNGSLSDTHASISTTSHYSSGIACFDYENGGHTGARGTVTNFGTVLGGYAIAMYEAGVITNGAASDTGAVIRGAETGVLMLSLSGSKTATVTNFGTIAGSGTSTHQFGILMESVGAGSRITNGSSTDKAALITGSTGVYVFGAGDTVTNFGTIQGSTGTSVYFAQAGDTLILRPGSTLLGDVAVGTGTIDAAGGIETIDGALANVGTIVGAGTLAVNGAIAVFAPGSRVGQAHVTLSGEAYLGGDLTVDDKALLRVVSASVGANDTLTAAGASTSVMVLSQTRVDAGGLVDAATGAVIGLAALTNAGTMEVTGGAMFLGGPITGAGSFQIKSGTLAEAGPHIGSVAFTGTTGVLELGDFETIMQSPVTYTGSISGLSTTGGSYLDFLELPFGYGETSVTYVDNGKKTGGTLTVSGNVGEGQQAQVTLSGDYTGVAFIAIDDLQGGTEVFASTSQTPPSPHAFVAAMAGFAAPAFTSRVGTDDHRLTPRLLVAPRAVDA